MNNINDLKEIKNKYFNVIEALFDNKNQKRIIEKLNQILNKYRSREEVTLNDIVDQLEIPDFDFYDLYEKGAKKLVYKGLIIEEKEKKEYHYYGEAINQIGTTIIIELIEKINNNYNNKVVSNLLFEETNLENKQPLYLITKLLIFTMNNYYENDYDKLLINNKGIIDYKINLRTNHGSLFQTVPVNDFLYGLFIDGLHTEKQFDRYVTKGSYQLLCEELDNLFINNNTIIDNNIIKKQLIVIANMFNNKIFYLAHYGIINQQLKNKLINRFNIFFNQILQSLGIIFYQDDFIKMEEAKNHSIKRLNKPLENF